MRKNIRLKNKGLKNKGLKNQRLKNKGLYMTQQPLNLQPLNPQSESEQSTSEFVTLTKQIEGLRVDYATAKNGWLEAAIANDPALDKYGDDSQSRAENLRAAIERKPSDVELLRYPGLTVMATHQAANKLYNQALKTNDEADKLGLYAQARAISEVAKGMTGADIHPGAQIAPNLFIDHNTGVVIGETAIIGENCFLLHGVTLGGSRYKANDDRVDGGVRRHPELGNGVIIGSNANVYGACYIGDNVGINTGATIIDGFFADCDMNDDKKRTNIGANTEITNSKIGKNVKIYADVTTFKSDIADNVVINAGANISNCEIGEGAVIGAGVRLNGVKVPAGARISEIEQPLAVVYSYEHQGLVEAKDQAKKVSVFAEIENVEHWQDKLADYATQKAQELGVVLNGR